MKKKNDWIENILCMRDQWRIQGAGPLPCPPPPPRVNITFFNTKKGPPPPAQGGSVDSALNIFSQISKTKIVLLTSPPPPTPAFMTAGWLAAKHFLTNWAPYSTPSLAAGWIRPCARQTRGSSLARIISWCNSEKERIGTYTAKRMVNLIWYKEWKVHYNYSVVMIAMLAWNSKPWNETFQK